jgi:membrane fusion protein, heavy metal efflux system
MKRCAHLFNIIFFVTGLLSFSENRMLFAHEEEKRDSRENKNLEYQHSDHAHVTLSNEQLKNAKLELAVAGPAEIETVIRVPRKIKVDGDRIAKIVPRFPGLVKEVKKRLGEQVSKGETLLVIESNESLKDYQIISPILGTVINKNITPGEYVSSDRTMLTIVDLRNVWADFDIYRPDFTKLQIGQEVVVHAIGITARSQISYLSPIGAQESQTMLARAVLPNLDGTLLPGLFVSADIVLNKKQAPVSVSHNGLQTVDGKAVLFVQSKDGFDVRKVDVGISGNGLVEIIAGLKSGERYATTNSFVLKSKLQKEEASED